MPHRLAWSHIRAVTEGLLDAFFCGIDKLEEVLVVIEPERGAERGLA
jgi:hypothetical protein